MACLDWLTVALNLKARFLGGTLHLVFGSCRQIGNGSLSAIYSTPEIGNFPDSQRTDDGNRYRDNPRDGLYPSQDAFENLNSAIRFSN